MKTRIIIEQYDNGITLKSDGNATVALDHEKERVIGKLVWEDIVCVMNNALCNVVTVDIVYGTGNTDKALEADCVSSL